MVPHFQLKLHAHYWQSGSLNCYKQMLSVSVATFSQIPHVGTTERFGPLDTLERQKNFVVKLLYSKECVYIYSTLSSQKMPYMSYVTHLNINKTHHAIDRRRMDRGMAHFWPMAKVGCCGSLMIDRIVASTPPNWSNSAMTNSTRENFFLLDIPPCRHAKIQQFNSYVMNISLPVWLPSSLLLHSQLILCFEIHW